MHREEPSKRQTIRMGQPLPQGNRLVAALQRLIRIAQPPEHERQPGEERDPEILRIEGDERAVLGGIIQRETLVEECAGCPTLALQEGDETPMQVRDGESKGVVQMLRQGAILHASSSRLAKFRPYQMKRPQAMKHREQLGGL